ncbi:Glu-tRNA(Gln) amidotransferase subunit GatE [Candidatus Woesearchaeota archaeon]|nr:Glu-tRNA(Gln) amidotransferase subunit GatE [Candidatus Woesearchaeota archaeon]
MVNLDYQKLGFKCGVEIHQELNTKKLFCDCSTSLNEKKQICEINRKIRAVAGETGEIDSAAAYEQIRNREFVYHCYENEACLVDTDSEPPHPVNKEALDISLGVAKLLKLEVPDALCVMRKTVTDGSSCSGFQRTILVGLEGKDSYLPKSKVKIEQLNLEEDACKIEKRKKNKVYYSLSRQGIPLLEIGTDASIKDPVHAKQTALEIGTLLRSFNVKRGIGTIRQDVNVSIRGGARIEVKGWQELKTLPKLIENEVLRQKNLLEIKKELKNRGLKKFKKNSEKVTEIFKNTKNKIISKLIKQKAEVYALVLPKFLGLLKKELCPEKTFGKELSEYAKAYGTKGMIHTDEDLKKYDLVKEFNSLKKELGAKKHDLILIIAGKEIIAKNAVDAVYKRANYACKGVPEETRIPNHHNATSSYARPLPGANRMYPETDVPMVEITKKIIDEIELPELITEKLERLKKEYNIKEKTAKELIKKNIEIKDYIKKYKNIKPDFIAKAIIEYPKEIKKRYEQDIEIEKHIDDVFERLNKKKISKDAVLEILVEIAKGKKPDYSKYELMDEKELKKEIKKIINQNKDLPVNAMIGRVMAKLRGKAPGKKIVDIIKKQMT